MKRFIPYILALVALVGCDNREPEPIAQQMLSFGTPVVEQTTDGDRAGAGSSLMYASGMSGMSIGLYGAYETGDDIFDDKPENLSYSGGKWDYTEHKPWNRIMDHEFRAFHPYDPTGSDRANGLSQEYGIQAMSDAGKLVLNYFTQTNKFDLMVARATRNPAADPEGVGKVTLNFKHTLAALQFEVKYATNEVDYLTSAYLNGLYASGTLYYGMQFVGDTEESINWILPVATSDELYKWEGSEKFTNTTIAKPFDGDNVIFVIPQKVNENQASFVFTTQEAADAKQQAYLPAITWEPGKKYVYTMTVRGAELDVNVTIKPWDDKKSNVDIYIQ